MKIVQMLNTMFGMFDTLSDKNEVYKVETVKDSFVGVSGAPEKVLQQRILILLIFFHKKYHLKYLILNSMLLVNLMYTKEQESC